MAKRTYTESSLIETPSALQALVEAVKEADVVGIDTEFQREGRLAPELCLLQLAVPDQPFVAVDPYADLDLGPLFEALAECEVVLHDARQDLEVIAYLGAPVPERVFDTQIAAGFLQCTDGRPGYARTVNSFLNVEVSRDQSMSDWSRRPLKASQIRYALEDVEYLLPLYRTLMDRLEARGRLEWAREASAKLRSDAIKAAAPTEAWTRVGGAKSLRGRKLSILAALARWREALSVSRSTLPKRVMSDSIMVALAKAAPVTEERLEDIRIVRRWVKDGHGPALLEAIQSGARADPKTWPVWPGESGLPGDPRLGAIALILDGCLKGLCRGEEISPWLVGTRADVELLARHWLAHRTRGGGGALSEGWRGEAFGGALTALLSGDAALVIDFDTPAGVEIITAD
ncbi:MAG: ribonuclease D [Bradymonadia bacterium]